MFPFLNASKIPFVFQFTFLFSLAFLQIIFLFYSSFSLCSAQSLFPNLSVPNLSFPPPHSVFTLRPVTILISCLWLLLLFASLSETLLIVCPQNQVLWQFCSISGTQRPFNEVIGYPQQDVKFFRIHQYAHYQFIGTPYFTFAST